MHSPLGLAVGNSLEVEEALACLRGAGPPDLRELVVVEGAMLLLAAGRAATMQEGRQAIARVLDSGEARDRCYTPTTLLAIFILSFPKV